MSSNLKEKADTQVPENTKQPDSGLVSDVKEIGKDDKNAEGETHEDGQKDTNDELPKVENKVS